VQYDAIIFDNDGVLVELVALDVLRDAAWEAFEAVGVAERSPAARQTQSGDVAERSSAARRTQSGDVAEPDPAHVERMVVGVTPDDLTTVAGAYDLDPEEFWRARDRAASEAQIEEIRAGRKALYDDVDALDALDTPMGIVSTNQQATVEFVLEFFDLGHLFEAVYGREPTPESLRLKKPETHYLERAMDDLGSETPLFVGDSETDLVAARRAGVDSAFIRRDHRADLILDEEPTHEIESLWDLHDVDGVPLRSGVAENGRAKR
jgi:HAD superfamily hydrolase (TIGR01549 family)